MAEMDERYATFREHAELRERTATLEETVRQVGPSLNRIETMIVAQKAAPQQQADHVALALQRAADVFERGKPSGTNPIITIFALFGALAMGALAVLLLT
jgi:hypothetical protein